MFQHAFNPIYFTTIWLFNSSPWKDPPFLSSVNHLFRLGPSIPWRTVSHNQMVLYIYIYWIFPLKPPFIRDFPWRTVSHNQRVYQLHISSFPIEITPAGSPNHGSWASSALSPRPRLPPQRRPGELFPGHWWSHCCPTWQRPDPYYPYSDVLEIVGIKHVHIIHVNV